MGMGFMSIETITEGNILKATYHYRHGDGVYVYRFLEYRNI